MELIGGFAVDSGFAGKKAKGAGLAAAQKAYSGLLMFTMLSRLAALAMPAPFGLVAALMMGRIGLKDERRRQLEQRRGEAKVAVRRFVDDFNLQVGKDSRNAVRHVQRELRTAWADRVSELQRSASEALAAAQASGTDTSPPARNASASTPTCPAWRCCGPAWVTWRRTASAPKLHSCPGTRPARVPGLHLYHRCRPLGRKGYGRDPPPGPSGGSLAVARRSAGVGGPRMPGVRRQPGDA